MCQGGTCRAFDTKGLPESGRFELYLGGLENLNLKCNVYTSFFMSGGIRLVPDPWSRSRGKLLLLWVIGSPKKMSTNFAVFLKVPVCKEILIELWMNHFWNSVYQILEHYFFCFGTGAICQIRCYTVASPVELVMACWPGDRGFEPWLGS